MSDWPPNLTVAPLRDWPGTLTPASARKRSQFSAPWADTLWLLDRELTHLRARNTELLVAISPDQFRQDGRPRAQAQAEHPGTVLSLDSRHGHLSYPCDTFTRWQDENLRATALALEALRKVDRYGVTAHGEQYRGFLALEAAVAVPATPFSHEPDSVLAWLATIAGAEVPDALPVTEAARILTRRAQRATHPDAGGDPEQFRLVSLAEQYLREAGAL